MKSSPTTPPGSLQDDLRFLERWVWIGGVLACFLVVATIVMAVAFLGRRDWSTANKVPVYAVYNTVVPVQYAANALGFALHGVVMLAAARRFSQARNSGGSVARAFGMLRLAIIVGSILGVVVGAIDFLPLWFL